MPLQNGLFSSRSLGVILLLLATVLFYNLGGCGVIETSEARYAEISREMLVSGDWLRPRLLGIYHFHKPPVTYIISAAGMALFGVNGFGVRFFLQVSYLLQALLVYDLGCTLFRNRKIAVKALIVYVTIPAVLISARNLTTDSFLATFELLSIWAWLKYKYQGKAPWLYLFYTSLALAFLTKGPVGLIFPVLVVTGFAPVKLPGLRFKISQHVAGLLLFLVLGASWYVYLMLQDAQFVDYFLMKHTVERYANPEAFSRAKPWWFYLVLAPALSLPWSAITLFNLPKFSTLPKEFKRLFICWLLVPLVFFSLSGSKLILYILPLFAGLALLVAWLLHQLSERTMQKIAGSSVVYFSVLAAGFIIAPFILPEMLVPGWSYTFPLLMGAGLYFFWRYKTDAVSKLLAGALFFTLLLIPYATHLMAANPDKVNSTSHLAAALQLKELAHRRVIVYDQLLPSLAFKLQQNFITVHDKSRHLHRETQFETNENWRHYLLQLNRQEDSTRLVKLLQQNVVLIVKGELPPHRQWMIRNLNHKKSIGRWRLYY